MNALLLVPAVFDKKIVIMTLLVPTGTFQLFLLFFNMLSYLYQVGGQFFFFFLPGSRLYIIIILTLNVFLLF